MRVHYLHNREVSTASWATEEQRAKAKVHSAPDKQGWLFARNYSTCLNSDRELNLPKHLEESSNQAWLDWLLRDTINPEEQSDGLTIEETTTDEEKEAWCSSNYASYDSSDGTVLRRGKKGREPCPYSERETIN